MLSAAQAFDLTGNITGNVSGSVGSVTAPVNLTSGYDAAKTAASQSSVNALVTDYLNHGTYGMAALLAAIQAGAGGSSTNLIDVWKVDWNDPNLVPGMIGYELMHPAQGLN